MEHTVIAHVYHLENIKDCDKQSLYFDQIQQSFHRTVTHVQYLLHSHACIMKIT